jgi:hypothetical protein
MQILQQNQIREETQLTNEILCCPMQEGNRSEVIRETILRDDDNDPSSSLSSDSHHSNIRRSAQNASAKTKRDQIPISPTVLTPETSRLPR